MIHLPFPGIAKKISAFFPQLWRQSKFRSSPLSSPPLQLSASPILLPSFVHTSNISQESQSPSFVPFSFSLFLGETNCVSLPPSLPSPRNEKPQLNSGSSWRGGKESNKEGTRHGWEKEGGGREGPLSLFRLFPGKPSLFSSWQRRESPRIHSSRAPNFVQ